MFSQLEGLRLEQKLPAFSDTSGAQLHSQGVGLDVLPSYDR